MSNQTIYEAVRAGAARLTAAGIERADIDAEVIMRHLLRMDRALYFVARNDSVTESTLLQFNALIEHRLNRQSVAYIVGAKEFMGYTFRVGPGVLVPRPETEAMVEWAISWLAFHEKVAIRAVDVGTGSGAIAISLAQCAPDPAITVIDAIDTSAEALAWARENLATVGSRGITINFHLAHLLEPVRKKTDLVLANLPYLTPEQVSENPDLAAEPIQALVSGADGLDLIRELIADLPRVLAKDGAAILEIDPAQSAEVMALARSRFPEATVSIEKDLAGLDRFVVIDREKQMATWL